MHRNKWKWKRNNPKPVGHYKSTANAKNWLIGKDFDAGREWGQEEKGTKEDEMAGWHHQLDAHEFGWTPGVGDGQGGLVCCNSWGCKELDMNEQLNWTELMGICPGMGLQGRMVVLTRSIRLFLLGSSQLCQPLLVFPILTLFPQILLSLSLEIFTPTAPLPAALFLMLCLQCSPHIYMQ